MSETFFSLNDLFRRRFQTLLAVSSLALSVGSTIFMLLSAERVGFGLSLRAHGTLTAGISSLFSPFIVFLVILILIGGGVMASFMVSMMMTQRRRDIGLMRAIGCPNEMVFGYFFNELLIVSLLGCAAGVLLGVMANFAFVALSGGTAGQALGFGVDFRILLVVFFVFFVLSLIIGGKPIFDTSRIRPAEAISPAYCVGLSKESRSRVLPESGFTLRFAVRSVVRHRSSTIKVVLCLTIVFTLVTVAIAGGLIAEETTKSWVERALGTDVILVAQRNVSSTYERLYENFFSGGGDFQFNYSEKQYVLNDSFLNELRTLPGIVDVDPRLLARTLAEEVPGIILGGPDGTQTVGDNRAETTLVVGIQPGNIISDWLVRGEFFQSDQGGEAVVGDTLSTDLFTNATNQNVRVFGASLDVVGVCVEPLNNGKVVYTPLKTLENLTGVSGPNLALVKVSQAVNRDDFLNQLRAVVLAEDPDFTVVDLQNELDASVAYLGYIWRPIFVLPLMSLVSASLVLVGFVALSLDEQRQELGVLRAVGARPRTVISIVAAQNVFVALSSYAMGTAFGTIITQLILIENPLVTLTTVLEIVGFLTAALGAIFLSSLYPAFRFAHRSLLETMRQG